jgi:hypothetical protein
LLGCAHLGHYGTGCSDWLQGRAFSAGWLWAIISVTCYLRLDALHCILSVACQIGRTCGLANVLVVHYSTGSLSDEFCGLSRSIK